MSSLLCYSLEEIRGVEICNIFLGSDNEVVVPDEITISVVCW